MAIYGNINQITSTNEKAFINLNANNYGMLEASSVSYKMPTYICFDKSNWSMKVFESQELADEWLDGINCGNERFYNYPVIYHLVENGIEVIRCSI
jgi:hypothetical protein